tara:strand:+ start:795 stop:1226 length:432 start_codon:yes stop_codon:yes gene_type:complete
MGVKKINGAAHTDVRGKLIFFNEFSMESIKRFYEINPSNTKIIRAWQGHLIESKWFYCTSGSFIINLLPLDANGIVSTTLPVERFVLSSEKPLILKVPGGYASGFKAITDNSKLIVFSDTTIAESSMDDFRYPETQYSANWEN